MAMAVQHRAGRPFGIGFFMSQRLRILLIGASGVLGRAVAAELSPRHDIVTAGSKSGDLRIDIADPGSIEAGLDAAGPLDAVACAAGAVNFTALSTIKPARIEQSTYGLGLANKLMGQVNLALAARDRLRDGGSITLIAGVTSQTPIATGSSASMVNGAIEAFVMAAAIELPRGLRINAVSPTVFEESMGDYGPFFRGFDPVPVARAARAFSRSVEGLETGKTYRVI
jgi:NAD(P)-dependent dehydrogenase (short-subunit alcohol dehydrogenase family)